MGTLSLFRGAWFSLEPLILRTLLRPVSQTLSRQSQILIDFRATVHMRPGTLFLLFWGTLQGRHILLGSICCTFGFPQVEPPLSLIAGPLTWYSAALPPQGGEPVHC